MTFLASRAARRGRRASRRPAPARDPRSRWPRELEHFSRWWAALEAVGLGPFWAEPNLVYINIVRSARPELAEYSFINIRSDHALVNEAFS